MMGYKRIIKEVINKKGEKYGVILTFDEKGKLLLHKSSCTCIFGSWWRFAGYWKKRGTLCWHMIKCIKEYNGKRKN